MKTYDDRHEIARRVDLEIAEVDNKGRPRRLVVADPEPMPLQMPETPPAALPARPDRARVELVGNYTDRAKGFSISTAGLSTVIALTAAGLTWTIGGAFGAAVVIALLGGYLLTWLCAFVLHTLASPEGAELIEVLSQWSFLKREQAERHRRYRRATGDDVTPTPSGWLSALLGMVIGGAVAGLGAVGLILLILYLLG